MKRINESILRLFKLLFLHKLKKQVYQDCKIWKRLQGYEDRKRSSCHWGWIRSKVAWTRRSAWMSWKGRLDPAARALKSHSKVILDPEKLFENPTKRLEIVHYRDYARDRFNTESSSLACSQIQRNGRSIMSVAYQRTTRRFNIIQHNSTSFPCERFETSFPSSKDPL